MVAIIVALGVQVAWHALRVVLDMDSTSAGYAQLVTLSIALIVATHVAVGAGAIGLARRHAGVQRVGAWVAAGSYLAIAVTAVIYSCLPPLKEQTLAELRWGLAMYRWGWFGLSALAVTGVAIAAGRRGLWLGPPAIGCALLHPSNPLTPGSATLVFGGIAAALVAVMAFDADRGGTVASEPDPERAGAGLRRVEWIALISAGVSVGSIILEITHPESSIYISLPWAILLVIVQLGFVHAAWSIGRARIGELPAWLWYLAATSMLWSVLRTARSWSMTVIRHWGQLDGVKLVQVHWSTYVPSLLAMVTGLVALAVFGRRRGSREIGVPAVITACFIALLFGVRIATRNEVIASAGCYVIANVAAARVYRAARRELAGHVPVARVLG